MRRRDFIKVSAGSAIAWPLTARAQNSGKLFRIGFLGSTSANGLRERMNAFRDGLRVLGHEEGRDIVIEARWADGHYERLPMLLADLIASKVDVIVTHGTPGSLAAKQATTTIPIVVVVVGDALSSGIVSNLARPEANVTGSTFFGPELAAKRVELLKEALPNLSTVGVMLNLANPMNEPILPQMSEIASSRKLTLRQYDVRSPADFDGVISAMKADVEAFVLLDDSMLIDNAPAIGTLALRYSLPSIGFPSYAEADGLLAFGIDFAELWRRAATFVDKIIKGAKPADLPFERASKFETIVNLKTAKAIGVELPTSVLLRADKVIE
jgi:putative tryptophan/tyrosine transport system substrate-binding protein